MQLQRSLFSFYNLFVRKTPIILWISTAVFLIVIIGWQIKQISNQEQVYNFEKCMIQYYNQTRLTEEQWKENIKQKSINLNQSKQNEQNAHNTTNQTNNQTNNYPYNLTSKYYMILNQTTTLKIYFSDTIKYDQNQPSCKIFLNTEKLRLKYEQKIQENPQEKSEQKIKPATILQQIQTDQNIDQSKAQKQQIITQQYKKQRIRSQNIKYSNELSSQERQYLINEHPSFHITANSHIIYLNQDNKYQQKHGLKVHAIVLSKQSFDLYPEFLNILSSKLWRLHGNQQIIRNQISMKSIAKSFQGANQKIKQLYKANLQDYNKKIAQELNSNKTSQNPLNDVSNSSSQKNNTNSIKRTNYVLFQLFQPISQTKIFFHYPETLRYQDLYKLALILQNKTGLFFNLFFLAFIFFQYVILSCLIGIFLRYLLIWIISIYLFAGGCFINQQWGWVFKYFNLVRKRNNPQNQSLFTSSFKMIILFAIALLGMLSIFTFGSKYILQNLYIYSMTLSANYYSEMMIKNFFIIELYYYICCRSRLALKYFPLFSLKVSFLILFFTQKFYFYNITWLINLHIIAHLILMCIFSALQNKIGDSQFYNQFTPSMQRPRALYYVGYDIGWQNTIPPIWTYFTTYFDLKHLDQREKALIDRDYQLLYGRLLGMNERQQLPEDQQVQNDQQVNKLSQNLSQSNQMSLIR